MTVETEKALECAKEITIAAINNNHITITIGESYGNAAADLFSAVFSKVKDLAIKDV